MLFGLASMDYTYSSSVLLIKFLFLSFVASNLLFVESPAGVGWSYSNTTSDYDCGDDSTGKKIIPS